MAHSAAIYGNLPDDFTQWDLADNYGRTVANTARLFKHLPAGETADSLLLRTKMSREDQRPDTGIKL